MESDSATRTQKLNNHGQFEPLLTQLELPYKHIMMNRLAVRSEWRFLKHRNNNKSSMHQNTLQSNITGSEISREKIHYIYFDDCLNEL